MMHLPLLGSSLYPFYHTWGGSDRAAVLPYAGISILSVTGDTSGHEKQDFAIHGPHRYQF